MPVSALILGCAGPRLTSEERAFYRDVDPWGFILFKRNCDAPEQIKALTAELRSISGRDDAPILIDQEGGRVQRLKLPFWPAYPAARRFGTLHARDPEAACRALHNVTRLIATDLHGLGISVDCMPVLDIPVPGAHDVIGDRAYGLTVDVVEILGRIVCDSLMAGGVLPVVKHVPGHGRAGADSHFSLPRVDAARDELAALDFAPFKALADMPMAMTAHVVYDAIDAERPATLSPVVIADIIRGEIGFDGLLMTDDLSMKALSGDMRSRMADSIAAGCDVGLHCNGLMTEMREVAEAAPTLEGQAASRAQAALGRASGPQPFDREQAMADLNAIMPELV